jgi:hypothetical protein
MTKPSSDDSVEFEPHLRNSQFAPDPSEEKAGKILSGRRPTEDDTVEHSVWDEPGLSGELSEASSAEKLRYSSWLDAKISSTSEEKTWLHTLFLVLFSGIWAVVGVFALALQGQGGIGLSAAIIFAPAIEEILKISTALLTVEKKPYLFKTPAQIFICCAMSGLLFATIENLLYLHIYVPEPSDLLVLWRWTVCMLLHSGCASISSVGLVIIWRKTIADRKKQELGILTKYIAAATLTHAAYNILAICLNGLFSHH